LIKKPSNEVDMLEEFLGQKVVIDLHSPYVCLGTLSRFDDGFFEILNADLHDLRDTKTSRENYIASSLATGIKRNRKKILVSRRDIISVSLLADVADE
jgi:small nuclear ribonucleoprotein (snRNP)-like protein